jgi:tetratricopeptide (TPR) repeat protein
LIAEKNNLAKMNEQKAVTEFDKGNQLLQDGKLEDAIVAYSHAIELNPTNSWFHEQLGEALAKLERLDEAVTAFRCAIELKPDFAWSYHHLGDALVQQQKWEEATEAFRKGIELNPQHFGTYCGLGQSLEKLGLLDEAIAAYRRASQLNPDANWIHHALVNALQQRTQFDLAEAIASYRQIIELDPDNLQAYHNLLQIQPDNWEVWLQLAQAFVRQEQIEKAIASYRRVVALNPSSGEAYHELGGTLARQEQWEEAILSYLEAVKLAPETCAYCHHLVEILTKVNQQELWERAINIYEIIISQQPDLSHVYYFLGDACRHTQQWEKAKEAYCRTLEFIPQNDEVQHYLWQIFYQQNQWDAGVIFYRKAIILHPEIGWFHYYLGAALSRLSQFEEAVTSYQKAIQLNVAPKSFWPHYLLGTALLELGKIDEAIVVYQKSLDNEPTEQIYLMLEQLLLKNNRLEEAVKWYHKILELNPTWIGTHSDIHQSFLGKYHDLGIQKAEEGKIKNAIACFRAAEKRPSEGEIYEQIWKGLNALAPLDENNPYHVNEFHWHKPYTYFCHTSTSKYKVILSSDLTDADIEFIEKSGFSKAYLQLMALDDINREKIFIQSFNNSQDITNLFNDNTQCFLSGKTRSFQQSIVETGYVYSCCPATGQILRSNQSFPLQKANFLTRTAYRFVGQEVFYLIASSWLGGIEYIYFPKVELIWAISYGFDGTGTHLINELKSKMVSDWKKVKDYITRNEKEIAVVTAFFSNFGHQVWNEFSGIMNLWENGAINKIDKFLVGEFEHFNIADIFPGIDRDRIVRLASDKFLKSSNTDILFKQTIENNYFVVRLGQTFIKEKLANMMYQAAKIRSSQEVLQEVKEAQQYFPLLCVQIRSHYRSWISQIEGTANIIKAIHSDFPNLAVVFDGWSIPESFNSDNSRVGQGIEQDRVIIEKIRKLIPRNIPIYNASGRTTWETVVWANAIHTFMATIGAGATYLTWIANKKGVLYSSKYVVETIQNSYTEKCRENCVNYSFVSTDATLQCSSNPIDDDFEVDWRVIYSELVKIIATSTHE